MCTLQEYLDKNIKETWLTEIKEDYTSNFLLGEDSLKCSFYFHLRNRLGEGWFKRHRLRIYPEFYLSNGHKADLAIVRIKPCSQRAGKHLSECVETVVALIELKFINGPFEAPFYRDRAKLRKYASEFKEAQLYAGFIQEKYYDQGSPAWFDARQTKRWANGRVAELIGYWDADGYFVAKVNSYNGMNKDLDNKSSQ